MYTGKTLVVASGQDPAGLNIHKEIIQKLGMSKVGEFEGYPVMKHNDLLLAITALNSVEAEHLEKHFKVEKIIFISKHESKTGKPCLTVHTPGNIGLEAKHGGRPGELAISHPLCIQEALKTLGEEAARIGLGEYQVSLEATHHGPTGLRVPTLFIEIGSSQKEWMDKKAASIVAQAAINTSYVDNRVFEAFVGVGGPHYAPNFTRVTLGGRLVGHIIPKHHLEDITQEILLQAIKKTVGCVGVILDWKGTPKNVRDWVKSYVSGKLGLAVVRCTTRRKTL
ncbi:MAG: hypothetical protein DRO11_00705 [Methanobacteriota archaeon]|nr:MAG: hypothetical protein DRO11_00705 [Euryarchaeota archaeon]